MERVFRIELLQEVRFRQNVHCCLNCRDNDESAHNQCREPQAELVTGQGSQEFLRILHVASGAATSTAADKAAHGEVGRAFQEEVTECINLRERITLLSFPALPGNRRFRESPFRKGDSEEFQRVNSNHTLAPLYERGEQIAESAPRRTPSSFSPFFLIMLSLCRFQFL